MEKAWQNSGHENEITQETRSIITEFFLYHKIKDIKISDEMKGFLKEQAKRLMTLRASGPVDRAYREMLNPVVPEVPSRLFKQFKKLYIGLKSLDEEYPDEKCRDIIQRIVDSSGNKVRQLVLNFLEKSDTLEQKWYKLSDVQYGVRLSRGSVKQQLETLWNMGEIEKKVVEERIGAYVVTFSDSYGKPREDLRGGHIEEVAYYRKKQG